MKQLIFLLIVLFLTQSSIAQSLKKRVLFIGNSYTNVNNLPSLLNDVANSNGDSVVFASNTPGGYTLELHSSNSNTLAKIAQGTWDYVVLQEQSQRPSFPDSQVQADVFPYAKKLDSLINTANSCAETIFYMTWGRENGDANNCPFFSPLCTYQGMDSLLNLRYQQMANDNSAIVSPVGAVWNYIRINHPNLNLYSSDGSHPSMLGSYVAACSFYTTIFRKDPTNISFNSSLSMADANLIKAATKLIVYDSLLNWNVGKFDNKALFDTSAILNDIQFKSKIPFMNNHFWDFGDGTTSSLENPTHTFAIGGFYKVIHKVNECGQIFKDSTYVNFLPLNLIERNIEAYKIYPNPVEDHLTIEMGVETFSELKVYTMNGKLIFSKTISSGLNKVDLLGFKSGVYVLEVLTEEGEQVRKKIIKL